MESVPQPARLCNVPLGLLDRLYSICLVLKSPSRTHAKHYAGFSSEDRNSRFCWLDIDVACRFCGLGDLRRIIHRGCT
jgi:hypothetical protein